MRRLVIAFSLIALIAFLYHAFPYALDDSDTRMRLLYVSLLLFLSLGGRRFMKGSASRMARDFAIWLTIIVVLVFAYSFRDELGRSRFMAELIPSRVLVNGDGTLSLRASDNGHFRVDGTVNGAPVRFMIDTGASDVVLSPQDARRAGFSPDTLHYDRFYTTANGDGTGAAVTLDSLTIGSITIPRMPASVNKTGMQESLLGMSFLRKLKGFRVEGNSLVLTP